MWPEGRLHEIKMTVVCVLKWQRDDDITALTMGQSRGYGRRHLCPCTFSWHPNLSYIQGNINQEVKGKLHLHFKVLTIIWCQHLTILILSYFSPVLNLCHYQLPCGWTLFSQFLRAGGSQYTGFKTSFLYTHTEACLRAHTHTHTPSEARSIRVTIHYFINVLFKLFSLVKWILLSALTHMKSLFCYPLHLFHTHHLMNSSRFW